MADELRAYRHLKKLFPSADFQRIESWTGTGIPDANACKDGVESWIECKDVDEPKRLSTLIKHHKVKPEQIAWELRRRKAGGRTFVALMVGKKFYLLPGKCLVELRQGMTREYLCRMALTTDLLFDPTYKSCVHTGPLNDPLSF